MKKFAIGCGILVLVLAVGGGIAAWWAYSKARQYVGSLTQFTEAAKLDDQVTNKAAFTPPSSGELTKEQVDRLVAVTERMRALLGNRFDELKRKYDALQAQQRAEEREATPTEVFGALSDFASLVGAVKQAQVTALNEQRLSLAEYRWVRDQAYAAAELPVVSFSLGAIAEAAQRGDTSALTESLKKTMEGVDRTPETNRALVAPHLALLRDTAALAWLGM